MKIWRLLDIAGLIVSIVYAIQAYSENDSTEAVAWSCLAIMELNRIITRNH